MWEQFFDERSVFLTFAHVFPGSEPSHAPKEFVVSTLAENPQLFTIPWTYWAFAIATS